MNSSYKLVYSEALNSWVAVAEHVSARGKKSAMCLVTAAALLAGGVTGTGWALAAPPLITPPADNQLPTGAQVAAGTVSFSQTQTATAASMAVQQSSNQAIVNWQSFNVGANARVNITQPSASSVLLNRVQSSDPSQIFGQINANGQVFLTNPNGVYFAPGSRVDVGSFTATTHSISDSDFLSGNYNFSRNGATGSLLNEGSITSGLGGYIALLAPEVRNQGVVLAQMGGTLALAAGESYQLLFNSNKQLTNVLVTPSTLSTLIENGNAVQAPGGLIILSAQAASSLLGGVVKNSGSISATGLVNDGGTIRLTATNKIELTSTSTISADAASNSAGNGGRIDIIADLTNATGITQVDGRISAKGGAQGGDGGFIETSANRLTIANSASVTAEAFNGKAGTWLLDPYDFTVASSGGDVTGAAIQTALATTDVTIQTNAANVACTNVICASGTSSLGDIYINDTIAWSSSKTLTLNAYNNIYVGTSTAGGSLTLTGTAKLVMVACGGNATCSAYYANPTSGVGSVLMGMAGSPTSGLLTNQNGFNGQINVSSTATNPIVINGRNYTVINSVAALTAITTSTAGTNHSGSTSNGYYVLGSDITSALTSSIIATDYHKYFSGYFNGFGHTINVALTNGNMGLFSQAYSFVFSNLGVKGSIANTSSQYIGGIVGNIPGWSNGLNDGTILNTYNAANITSSGNNVRLAGIIGSTNYATLSNVYNTGSITVTSGTWVPNAGYVVGLVGYANKVIATNVYNTGAMSASTGQTVSGVAGLFGFVGGGSIITNAYNTGNITVGSNSIGIGGIFAIQNWGPSTFTNIYSSGTVTAGTGSTAVGIIGGMHFDDSTQKIASTFYNSSNASSVGGATITNPFGTVWTNYGVNNRLNCNTLCINSSPSATTYYSVTPLTTAQMTVSSNFTGFTFSSSAWGYSSVANSSPILCQMGGCVISNTYIGVSGGTWSTASNWSLAIAPLSSNISSYNNIIINGGKAVYYDTNSVGSLTSTIENAGTISFTGSSNVTLSGVISGAGSLNTANTFTGTTTLSGANTYTGTTTISAGTLSVSSLANGGSSSNLGASTNAATNLVLDGGTLKYTGPAASTNRLFTITGNGGTIDASGTGALTFTGSSIAYTGTSTRTLTLTGTSTASNTLSQVVDNNTGATSLTKSGAGTWLLSGTNTYTGATTVSAGTLSISNAAGLGGTGAGTSVDSGASLFFTVGFNVGAEAITLNGGTLRLQSGTGSVSGTVDLAANSSISVDSGAQLTLSGLVYGTGRLTKTSLGTLVLTGTNTYTGGTTISAGTLQLGAGGTTGSIEGNVTNSATLAFNRSDDLTYANVISGTGAVTKSANNTLTFTGNNTYSGGTTISAGTLKTGSATALGSGTVSVTNLAALDLNGQTMTSTGVLTLNGTGISSGGALTNSSSTAGTYAGNITLGMASSMGSSSGDITASGVISGAHALTKIGTDTLTLSGANLYSGGTTISGGTLKAGSATAFGAGAISVTSGAALDLNGKTMTSTGALTLRSTGIDSGGALLNSSSTGATYAGLLTLGAASSIVGGTGTIALSNTGTISGATYGLTLGGAQGGSIASIIGTTSGTLTKEGAGTWTLSGANTYTGGTTISAGTLKAGSAAALGTGAVSIGAGVLDLTFSGTVALSSTLSMSAGAAITNSANTSSFSVAGTSTLAGNINTAGNQTYTGAVTLGADSSLSTLNTSLTNTNGTISFSSTFDSASASYYGLSVSNGTGITAFAGIVGANSATSALGYLCINSTACNASTAGTATRNGTTTLAGNVTTSGTQTYGGAVIINRSSGITLTATANNGAVSFGSTVNSYSGTTYALTINNGTGATSFTGAVGATNNLGALTLNGTGTITLGGNVTTQGDQTYAGPVSAAAGIVITANSTSGTTGILTNGYINNTNYAVAVQTAGSFPYEPSEYNIQTGTSSAIIGTTGTIRGVAVGVLFYNTTNIEGADNGMASGNGSSSWCCYNVPYLVDAGRSTLLTKISVSQRAGDGIPSRLPTKVFVYGSNTPFTTSATMRIGNNDANISNVSVLGTGYQQSNFTEIGNGTLSPALTTSGTPALGSVSFTNTTAYRYYQIAFVSTGQTTVAGSYAQPLALQAINLVGSAYAPSSVTFNGAVTASGALTVNTTGFTAANMTSGGALTINNSGTGSVTGVISNGSNAASLVKQGDGTLTLSGTNTYSGGTTISAGTLQVGAGSTTGSITNNVSNSGALIFNSSDDLTFTGAISGTGAVTKSANNTLTFTGNNTYSGGTTISAGTFKTGSATALGSGTVSVTNLAALDLNGQTMTSTGVLTLNGTGISSGGALTNSSSTAGTYAGNIALGSDTSIGSSSGDITASGVISGAFALTKIGTDTLTLAGTNTFTGITTVSAGTLAITNNAGLGNTSSGTTVASGATLDLRNVTVGAEAITLSGTLSASSGSSSLSGGVTMGANSTASVAGTQLTFSGVVSGGYGLTKTGSGSLILSGTNTYTGATTVSAGTLAITNNAGLGDVASGTTVASVATLDLQAVTVGAEAITLSGGTLSASSGSSTLSGAVSLTSASSVGGAGTLTLSGAITSNGYGLAILGAGAKTLSSTSNTLSTIATGSGVGALSVVNNAALTIGQVTTGGSTYSGINSTGTVSVSTRTGDLTVSQNVVTTSTASSYSTPALKLSASSLTVAGTATGGDVVLSGAPTLSVSSGGVALIYSGYASSSNATTLLGNLSSKTAFYQEYNRASSYTPSSGPGYYALLREAPTTIYLLPVAGQSSTYGTAPTSLNYCYSSSEASCVNVSYTGVPSTSQSFSLANSALTSSVSVTSGVIGSVVLSGPTAVASGFAATTDAGTYALTLRPSLTLTGYVFSSGNAVNYTVGAKTVNIANTARTITYDGLSTYSNVASGMSYTVEGLVGQDAVRSLTQTPGGTVVAGNVANAGSFAVTPGSVVLSTGKTSNYNFAFTAAQATVAKKDLVVKANNDAKFVAETDAGSFNGVSYDGFVANQTSSVLSGSISIARSNASVQTPGTYTGVLSAAGSSLSSNNYNITFATGDYTIVPADQLLIRLDNASSTYGTAPSYSLTSVQYKNSTTGSVVTLTSSAAVNTAAFTLTDGAGGNTALTFGPISASLSSAGQVAAGSYQVGASSITNTSTNYGNTVKIVGALSVAQKTLTAAATSGLSKTYDGNTTMSSLGLGLTGVVGVDAVTASGVGAYANANAGTGKSFTVSGISLSGSDSANYTLASNTLSPSTGVITPATLLIKANNASKSYDAAAFTTANAATTGVTYSGFVNNESSTVLGGALSYGGTAIGAVNVGSSYVITPAGQTSSNYAITFGNGALTITAADVSVSATNVALSGNVGKVYDGTSVATLTPSNYVISGWQGSDSATITKTAGTYDTANAGANKLVSVTLASSDFSATGSTMLSNYNLPTDVSGYVGVISAKSVTLTNTATTTTYDGVSNYAAMANSTAFTTGTMVGSDAVGSVTQSTSSSGLAQAGVAYSVTPSAPVLSTGNADNYSFSYVASTNTVSPKAVNLTISKTYDASTAFNNGNTYSITGMVNSETAPTITSGAANTSSANAATYSSFSNNTLALSNGNYTLNGGTVAATISPATLSAALVGTTSKAYDGNTDATLVAGNFALTGFVNSEGASVSKTLGTFNNADAGTGKAVLAALSSSDFAANSDTFMSNYILPTSASGSIGTITLAPIVSSTPVVVLTPVVMPASAQNYVPPSLTVLAVSSSAVSSASAGGSSSGVSVSTISSASAQVPGLVTVLVPTGTATAGSGFVIALPEQVVSSGAAGASVQVTLPNNEPLPAWIRYDAATQTLVTSAVPSGAFPLSVVVTVGGQSTVIQISESQSSL